MDLPHTFHAEQWPPDPIELVFAFFANPEDLPRLMPSGQKARIEEAAFASPPPRPVAPAPALRLKSIAAGPGTRVTFSFRPFPYSPLRIPWEAEVPEFVWKDRFCDIQLRGPFASWRRRHNLHPETRANTSGALLRDQIEYSLPYGPLGSLAHRLSIARQLRTTFAYRHRRALELLPVIFAR